MAFSEEIIEWYHLNKRDLPWRKTSNPYKVWLSEIILQQTRVVQGHDYYLKFITEFPTIKDLANAEEDKILKLWQGLGYYSRARNLHFAAKQVCSDFDGCFPSTYKDIIKLKGVGEYTAAAIASFCFNESTAVVDGNVFRFLSRYFGIEEAIDSTNGKKTFKTLANELLNNEDPATHNQAIMEFGALQCTPKSPDCSRCSLRESCYAIRHNKVNLLPRKDKKTKQRNRYFYYIYINQGNHTYIEQRTEKGIWQNLYQFPLIEVESPTDMNELVLTNKWQALFGGTIPKINKVFPNVKHILSHQILHATFIMVQIDKNLSTHHQKIPIHQIAKYPVPILISNFIDGFVQKTLV